MYCEKCGCRLKDADVFCPSCGTKVLTGKPAQEEESSIGSGYEFDDAQAQGSSAKGKKIAIIISIVCVVLVGVGVGLYFIFFGASDETQTTTQPSTSVSATKSADKKESTTAAQKEDAPDAVLTQADKELSGIISASKSKNVSFVLMNVQSGESKSYGNAAKEQTASALVVYPVMYACMEMMDEGKLSANTPITVNSDFFGRGVLKKSDNGSKMPLEKMLKTAICNSDNAAINSLLRHIRSKE